MQGFSVRHRLTRMDDEALLTFALPLTPAGAGDVKAASGGLRRVERADADAVGDLYWRAYPPGLAASDLEDAVADIRATFDGEYGVFWPEGSFVVEVDGAVVGVTLTVWRAPWPGTPDGPFVVELFTDSGSRRCGHAKRLLAAVATAASTTGEDVIGLRVVAGNGPALNLYRSFGFHEI